MPYPGLEDLENRACTRCPRYVHPELTHLSGVMEPAIEQVAERVYSAVGFDSANSTFVVGDDGIVVIDAMTSTENMGRALTGVPRDQRAAGQGHRLHAQPRRPLGRLAGTVRPSGRGLR